MFINRKIGCQPVLIKSANSVFYLERAGTG